MIGKRVPGLTYDEKALASQQKEAVRRPLSRRTVLASAAAIVGLPWMESLVGRNKVEAATARPVRFVCWHTPNGIYRQNWFPAPVAGPNYTLSTSLAPLAPLKKKALVFSGMQNNDASIVFGSHCVGVSGMLTCVLGNKQLVKIGISVDQVAAEQVGRKTRFGSLELGCEAGQQAGSCDSGYSCAYSSNISWKTESTPVAKEVNPRLVFFLFGEITLGKLAIGRFQAAPNLFAA